MNEQTWTDEQLQECLDTLNKQIDEGNNPTFCLHQVPHRFPWCGVRYILEHKNEAIDLSLPQAYQVDAWLNEHMTANVPIGDKRVSYTNTRVFNFVDTLANSEYLFKTEFGSLVTESMLKEYVLDQLEMARKRLSPTDTSQLRIVMEVNSLPAKETSE